MWCFDLNYLDHWLVSARSEEQGPTSAVLGRSRTACSPSSSEFLVMWRDTKAGSLSLTRRQATLRAFAAPV